MKDAIKIIAAFVWNLLLKRALTDAPGRNEEQNFWRIILGTTFDMAVIEWCKLFGSNDEEQHWKKHVPNTEHDAFRAGLLKAVGVTADEWKAYWEDLKRYRDQHAAHFDADFLRPSNNPTYPDLTRALAAARYYYDWLIKRLNDDGIAHSFPADLSDYCQQFHAQAREIAEAAYKATSAIQERVR